MQINHYLIENTNNNINTNSQQQQAPKTNPSFKAGSLDSAMIINEWGGVLGEIRNTFEKVMDDYGLGHRF